MTDSYVQFLRNHRAQTNDNQGSTHSATVETRYVKMPSDQQRWLHVKREKNGQLIALCENTQVTMIRSSDGYTYFKVADGTSDYVGETVCISDGNVDRFLSKTPPSRSSVTLSVKYGKRAHGISAPRGNEDLDQQWGSLTIPGGKTMTVTLNSVWNGRYSPIPAGIHRIMAPDAPHDSSYTKFYVDYAKQHGMGNVIADQVWFPIELAGSRGNSTRYVHIGNLSEGCVTVYALEHWNDVYNFLISHRLPDTRGRYVANLEVTK
ncbi:hypothetical protein [Caballeronia concitans]|jgi:hypothetical protein|uniref:Uncharacterized protein n=1 Tax=Caballeronia concitans TaxID=1777133 RepID=A0A658QUG4_9BURK|nr:hypothetical protein [Caballeronia concitans]KIG09429.1 hypothetical protein BurMR1_3105 [Burkholderia sp. MR1]SAL22798.1 hypothetical protein AWB72_01627 [Caballeronia concitans]